jgi:hypothetical protein
MRMAHTNFTEYRKLSTYRGVCSYTLRRIRRYKRSLLQKAHYIAAGCRPQYIHLITIELVTVHGSNARNFYFQDSAIKQYIIQSSKEPHL